MATDKKTVIGSLAVLIIFLVAWQAIANAMNPLFFAAPSLIGITFITNLPVLLNASQVFLFEFCAGLLIALGIGIALGLLIGGSRKASYALDPYVNALYATPIIAFLPLMVVWFGIGGTSRLLFVVASAVFPILLNVAYGVQYLNPNLVETARAFNLSRVQTITKVVLPGTVPYIAAGLRLAVGTAIVATVIAEMLLQQAGLGELLNYYGNFLLAPDLFSVVLTIAIIAVAFTEMGRRLERKYSKWR